jgi:hypothetical protein
VNTAFAWTRYRCKKKNQTKETIGNGWEGCLEGKKGGKEEDGVCEQTRRVFGLKKTRTNTDTLHDKRVWCVRVL